LAIGVNGDGAAALCDGSEAGAISASERSPSVDFFGERFFVALTSVSFRGLGGGRAMLGATPAERIIRSG